jgi:S-adenosylmethionine:tRNA ribosyltransferase-isomerase
MNCSTDKERSVKKTKDYYFDLPEELIAQYPADRRGESRLFVLNREKQSFEHAHITDIIDHLPEDSIIVVNDSRVRKARVYGKTDFSGSVEFLFIQALDERTTWEVMSSKSKRQKVGRIYHFPGGITGTIVEDRGNTKVLTVDKHLDESFFDTHGHMPLPPYIRREDEISDQERYQTIYAEKHGSVAAPTAGLHFTGEILDSIKRRGIQIVPVTLHVGLGTFLPIRTEDIDDHLMHTEQYEISDASAAIINKQLASGKPVIAVGTTSVRTLESAYDPADHTVRTGLRSTNLFITPGYTFNVVDHLLTNFHTPESTLLILVSAFAGRDLILSAYQEAVKERYRFFSYGDAMFII